MTKIKDQQTALAVFIEAAIKQAEATEQGDYKNGNKYYDQIIKSAEFLKKTNSVNILLSLLSNPSVGIRLWAAYFLLPINEKEAIKALQAISKISGIHSLTAETTLKEWQKGNLNP